VPRILPLKLSEDAETLHKQAATVLYRLWREEAQATTAEQGMEIHRLALRGKAEKIALEIATALTDGWYDQSRYREAVEVCRSTLEVFENYRIVHNLAISEAELGLVKQADEHHQQVFNLCPPEDETQKAATLHCLGMLKANYGEIFEAITLCEQSLKLNESIGNIQGKAETLQCLGMLKTKSGEISEAVALYRESLEIFQRIGHVRGEAATMHQLAILKANSGKISEAIALCKHSLKLKDRIGNVKSQAATLAILGQLLAYNKGDLHTALDYLQQSLEILQRIQSPEAENVRQHIARVQQMAQNLG
jgi:tetratricopeptide (TPR) repeat protein